MIGKKRKKFQHSFEEVIKDILHKEPTRDLPRASIQTLIKSNLTRNFNLDTKNQFTRTIEPIDCTRSTIVIRITRTIRSFSILENITQQLLENKHTFTLGQFFKITPDLKQYVVAKLALGKKKTIIVGPNLVIALVVIDCHMVVIQVQVNKNIVENVLLDGGSNVNIMMEKLWKMLGLPNSKPTPYTLWMVDKPITKLVGLIKDLKIQTHGIPYIATFMVMKNNVLDSIYSMLSGNHGCVMHVLLMIGETT
jgi:hypothetical protein